jgi:hypothetical protein
MGLLLYAPVLLCWHKYPLIGVSASEYTRQVVSTKEEGSRRELHCLGIANEGR